MAVRIYGQTVKVWKSEDERGRSIITQKEIAYKEFDPETGEVVGVGTEDFSLERYYREVEEKWLYTWDGQKRNKGGYRWFEGQGQVRYRKQDNKSAKKYYKNRFHAELVQFR